MKHKKWHELFFKNNYRTKIYEDAPPGWPDPSIDRYFRCSLCGFEWTEHQNHYRDRVEYGRSDTAPKTKREEVHI